MRYAVLLSSQHCDIDTLAEDGPVLAALLENHARASNSPQLPPAWHLEDVTSELKYNRWSAERGLWVTGTIVPDTKASTETDG